MKKEKESKTIINNWGLEEIFRYKNINLIFKWAIIIMIVSALISLIAYPVKIYSDIDCGSGNFNLAFEHLRNNETKQLEPQYISLDGIKDMNCKAKVRVDIPLIGLLFV